MTSLLDLLGPCPKCGANTLRGGDCSRCRPPRQAVRADRSETNEADIAAYLDDLRESQVERPLPPMPTNPVHACAGELCGTYGCSVGRWSR